MRVGPMPYNKMDGAPSAVSPGRVENVFALKARSLLGVLAWGMRCGIPLDEAVLTLKTGKYKEPRFDKVLIPKPYFWNRDITRMAADLKAGFPLSEAVRHMRRYLPPHVPQAMKVAESRGVLDKMIPFMAEQMPYMAGVLKQRLSAFIYPLFLLLECLGFGAWMVSMVLPRFIRIYNEMLDGEPMPGVGAACFQAMDFFPLLAMGVWFIITSAILFGVLYRLEPVTRMVVDFFLLRIPFIGRDMRRLALLEFAGGMACYVGAGMDVAEAADMTAETLRSAWLRKRVRRFAEMVRNGAEWTDAWEELRLGYPFYDWLLRNSAAREDVAGGFSQLVKVLKNDISNFTISFVRWGEIGGTLLNGALVALIVIGIGTTLYNIVEVLAANSP